MAQRLSRRKYAEICSFLRSVIVNPKTSIRTRMQAAARLDSIFERAEAQAEREQARKDAREREARAALVAVAVEPAPIPLTAEQQRRLEDAARERRIEEIFGQVLKGGR